MIRALLLLLTVLTGFSGLVYEVTWQKALATLLGSHSEATAAVLGIFLGGLSLGYSLFGSLTRRMVDRAEETGRPPRLLLAYGLIEVTIGLLALGFMTLFSVVQSVSLALPQVAPGIGFTIDVLLTILLIGPPTVLMGGTIPILTQALAESLDDATRFHALVYGFNTAGAFAGALAAGFVLIPSLGIAVSLQAMGALNLFAGAVFVLIGLRPRAVLLPSGPPEDVPLARGFASYGVAALLLGFAMMAVQTVLVRLGGLALGASHFTFSMVVAVFVLCIALGSLSVSAFSRVRPVALIACAWGLALLLAALYTRLPDATYWAHVLRVMFRSFDPAFYPYHVSAFVLILAMLALPVGLSGATLPLMFHEIRREMGDLGQRAGRLYSWNTVGSLLGALLGGYALLFWLDLHHVYRLAIAAVVGAAALLTVRVYNLSRAWAGALLLPILGLLILPPWDPTALSVGLYRLRTPTAKTFTSAGEYFDAVRAQKSNAFYDDDPTATITVKQPAGSREPPSKRALYTNGKADGNLPNDYATMALVGLVPCLLADRCEQAFVVGYGTGVTTGELAALDSMREVSVAEISPGVIEAAPLFDFGNQQASSNPKVSILRGDAYRTLLRSEGRYDVIVSQPSNPWVTGVEMLYSLEFLQAAKEQLRPGGVYAQWFHRYETDAATVELVLRTYTSVFDSVSVWSLGVDYILLGLDRLDSMGDVGLIEQRTRQEDFAAGLQRAGVRSLLELLALEVVPVGVLHASDLGDTIHTLFHPLLSDRAARAFFRGERAILPFTAGPEATRLGAQNSLLRQHAARMGAPRSDVARQQVLRGSCRTGSTGCVTRVAQWWQEDPDSQALSEFVAHQRRLPGTGKSLDPALVRRIAELYAEPAEGQQAPLSYEEAVRATEFYSRYFNHAAPFERAALRAIWQRCRDSAGRCAVGRLETEQVLGRLSGS